MMERSVLFLFVTLMAILPHTISAQSEGDVRLEDGPHPNLGRLEIFWKGKWSTFCGLSTGGAQAACRQMGFFDFISYKPLYDVNPNLNITEAEPGTPIAIQETECERSFSNGLLHVLRCGYSTKVDADCTHRDDTVLQCEPLSLWTHPYETQVRLHDNASTVATSSGTLEIFHNKKWGNVCGDDFNRAAADSTCRQMGYTSVSHYSTTSEQSADTVWLLEISCQGASCYCLSGCFSSNPTTPTTCTKVVHVTCTYDVSIENKTPSGSRDICENKQSACDGPSGPSGRGSRLSAGAIAGIALAVIAVVVLATIVLAVVVFVGIPKWKKRGYTSVQ